MSASSTVVSLDRRGHLADEPVDDDGVVETKVGGIDVERVRSIIERIERLNEEARGLSQDIKDIFQEGKSAGFPVRALRRVIKIRAMKPEHRMEEDDWVSVIMGAIGAE